MTWYQFFLESSFIGQEDPGTCRLMRVPLGMPISWAEALRSNGQWFGDKQMLLDLRNNEYTYTEIAFDQAVKTINNWTDLGFFESVPDLLAPRFDESSDDEYLLSIREEISNSSNIALNPKDFWQYYVNGEGGTIAEILTERWSCLARLPAGGHQAFAEVVPGGERWMLTAEFARSTQGKSSERFIEIDRRQAEEIARGWLETGKLKAFPDFDGGMTPVVADFVLERLGESGYPGELVESASTTPEGPRFDWRPLGAEAVPTTLNLDS